MKKYILVVTGLITVALTVMAFATWTYEGQWGSGGLGDGQFNYPVNAAIAPNNNVYVTDFSNNRVQYLSAL